MTTLIQQRTPHDCALACMAMLIGKTWEETNAIIGDLVIYEGDRRGMHNDQEALERLGFEQKFENGRNIGNVACLHRMFAVAPEYFLLTAWGRRALLSVPSLNNQGGWHMVYYDGYSLFDPSPLKTYGNFFELRPDEIAIFRVGAP